jgi:hypothetical protein
MEGAGRSDDRGLAALLRRPALGVPSLASYRLERWSELAIPIASGMMEGGFVGVVAAKIFHAPPAMLALISAAPMFGNLSSFAWARLAQGRRKIPFMNRLQAALVLLVAAVALVPGPESGALGGLVLSAEMVAARFVVGGIVTVRSLVWTLNYPAESRARVTSRLTILSTLTITVTSLVGGALLDGDPARFRWVYAAGALCSSLGVLAYSRVRVIDEPAHLAAERGEARALHTGAPRPAPLRDAFAVLRRDPLFARYQSWQALLGASNMMIEAPLLILVRDLEASYTVSVALTLAIPLGVSLVTIPFWAAYLDRVHITEFRAVHSWLWGLSMLLTWVGALAGSIAWLAVARIVIGVARGGGSLAWSIGHNDFAEPENAGLYMGIHVTLTGVRGAVAPFLGTLLYAGFAPFALPWTDLVIPGVAGIGGHAMLVAAITSTIATLGFVRLRRRMGM